MTTEIIELLSDNFGYIVMIIILLTQRQTIASLITRLAKLTFKNGDSELCIETITRGIDNTKEISPAQSMEPIVEKDEDKKRIAQLESEDGDNFRNMMLAFTNGNIDEAKAEFEKYAIKEEDTKKLVENKAIYLYRLFENGQDNSAVKQLEQLADTVEDEESKYKVLSWLSFCLQDSSQYDEDVKLWNKALSLFSIEILITKATINLSRSLNQTDRAEVAKKILSSRLQAVATNDEKSKIYNALSAIELSLNNTEMSIFCRDKSLEYNPNDRDELFNIAFDAGEKNINELSLSNYTTLLRIDRDNAPALNNLGVQAQEAELKILAVNNYKKSSEYKNTLAMANKGSLLLDAGFAEEAEKIALEAVELEDTHPNIYSLLTKINDSKKAEEAKWNTLIIDAQKRQKYIRDYTNSYYIPTSHTFDSTWVLPNAKTIDISVTDNKLKANWSEKALGLTSTDYYIEIIADINNSSFRGQYKKIRDGENKSQNLLFSLSGDENISCFGIMSEDGKSIQIVAEDFKNKFSLLLKKVQ